MIARFKQEIFDPIVELELEADRYDEYYAENDGHAVLYSRPFVKLMAVLRGERPLFADIRACWARGESIWQLTSNWALYSRGRITFIQALFSYDGTFMDLLKYMVGIRPAQPQAAMPESGSQGVREEPTAFAELFKPADSAIAIRAGLQRSAVASPPAAASLPDAQSQNDAEGQRPASIPQSQPKHQEDADPNLFSISQSKRMINRD